jgi:hypothetical protein
LNIGHFLGKIQRGRAGVDKDRRAFVDKPCRLLRDFDFFVRVNGGFLNVRLARRFLHVLNGHCAAAYTDDFSFLFQ